MVYTNDFYKVNKNWLFKSSDWNKITSLIVQRRTMYQRKNGSHKQWGS